MECQTVPINQGDLIQLTFVSRWNAQVIMLTTHYKCRTPPTGSMPTSQALQGLIDYVDPADANSLGSMYLGCLPENLTLREIWAQKIYPTREVKQSKAVSYTGNWPTAEASTGNIGGVITLRTDKAGRSQVGNKHIGPLPQDAYSNGQISGAAILALDALGEALVGPLNTVNTGQYDAVIYHRSGDGAAQKSDLIGTYVVQTTARVMRRRTVGLGI